jgi:type II secretory ATPase GspE/PulE/Tfp pilus assembly ATPase PilB-like protein
LPDELSAEYLRHHHLLPLEIVDGVLKVAVVGHPDPQAIDDLTLLFDKAVEFVQVDADALEHAIQQAVDSAVTVVGLGDAVDATFETSEAADGTLADVRDLASQPPVIRYVNLLIRDGFEAGASDIHLENQPEGIVVRLRIDGVLTTLESPPQPLQSAILSRIKLLADLDIAERRIPQDGRLRVRLAERELDVRVSTVPSFHGESVVMRLLDPSGNAVALDQLGMSPEVYDLICHFAEAPHGIVLVTGPTGSGKTTTLYAALSHRRDTSEKIITVEDPVEYSLPGVIQVAVNERAGLTFAAVLRSVLRQDPDVVFVGEMRDSETACIAIRAAMTGHLVFSTLHTNDAFAAIPRLLDLDVEDYLVSSTVEAVLAQRLVRKICPECVERYQPDAGTVALLSERPVGRAALTRGVGCPACRGTGFRGRTGIFELLVLDDEIKDAILRRCSRAEFREMARSQGMATLRQDGWSKVEAGITTVEEVLRVVAH